MLSLLQTSELLTHYKNEIMLPVSAAFFLFFSYFSGVSLTGRKLQHSLQLKPPSNDRKYDVSCHVNFILMSYNAEQCFLLRRPIQGKLAFQVANILRQDQHPYNTSPTRPFWQFYQCIGQRLFGRETALFKLYTENKLFARTQPTQS